VAVSLAAARWHVRLRAFVPLPLDHAEKRDRGARCNLSASMIGQTFSQFDRAVGYLLKPNRPSNSVSGANSKNSSPYGGVKEVGVASFPSYLHIERENSSR
jgi:hypothetical protein